MIHVEHLTKRYGDIVAVDDLSFDVKRGEVLGFLGPNGAGKTTSMRMLTGYLPPTAGTIEIGGYDIFNNPHEAKMHIGYLPENPPIYNDMSVADYLDFVADLKQVAAGDKSRQVSEVIESCGIGDVKNRLIGNLSRGYKQRIGIAQALVSDPSVVILDEPTVGLDPKQIIEIRELIRNLADHKTVVLSTHILPEVTMVCSKVIIINRGKMALEQRLDSLSDDSNKNHYISFKVNGDSFGVKSLISTMDGVENITESNRGEFEVEARDGLDLREGLSKLLVDNGFGLLEIKSHSQTIEEVFLSVISTEG